jgi:hypothetical protein
MPRTQLQIPETLGDAVGWTCRKPIRRKGRASGGSDFAFCRCQYRFVASILWSGKADNSMRQLPDTLRVS